MSIIFTNRVFKINYLLNEICEFCLEVDLNKINY